MTGFSSPLPVVFFTDSFSYVGVLPVTLCLHSCHLQGERKAEDDKVVCKGGEKDVTVCKVEETAVRSEVVVLISSIIIRPLKHRFGQASDQSTKCKDGAIDPAEQYPFGPTQEVSTNNAQPDRTDEPAKYRSTETSADTQAHHLFFEFSCGRQLTPASC